MPRRSGTRLRPTRQSPASGLPVEKAIGATHHGRTVLLGVLLPLGLVVAVVGPVVSEDAATGWDRQLAHRLYDQTHSRHDAIDHLLQLGRVGGAVLIVLLVTGLAIRGRRSTAFLVAAAMAGVLVIDLSAKALFADLQLDPPNNATFAPSGHAMASLAAAGSMVLAVSSSRHRTAVAALGAIVVAAYGFMLVARNWHYPSEVVAGWLLALAWLGILSWAAAWVGDRRSSAPNALRGAGPSELEKKLRSTR
jgi:membrane-associated phospholipid phosphatase